VVIGLALLGVRGRKILHDNWVREVDAPVDRDPLAIAEILAEDLSTSAAAILRPAFDMCGTPAAGPGRPIMMTRAIERSRPRRHASRPHPVQPGILPLDLRLGWPGYLVFCYIHRLGHAAARSACKRNVLRVPRYRELVVVCVTAAYVRSAAATDCTVGEKQPASGEPVRVRQSAKTAARLAPVRFKHEPAGQMPVEELQRVGQPDPCRKHHSRAFGLLEDARYTTEPKLDRSAWPLHARAAGQDARYCSGARRQEDLSRTTSALRPYGNYASRDKSSRPFAGR
jgi:hypothetical protein